MSTLQVANLHLESTGNNRIQYGSSNIGIYSGGSKAITVTANTTYGNFGPVLLETVNVSDYTNQANITFSNTDIGLYAQYFITYNGVSGNGVTATGLTCRLQISSNNTTYSTQNPVVLRNANTSNKVDGIVKILATPTSSNAVAAVVDVAFVSTGVGTADLQNAGQGMFLYGSNTLNYIRLYGDTAGFGTSGVINLYGSEKLN